METQAQSISKKEKTKSNFGQLLKAICGVAIIIFILSKNGLYLSFSAESIGYNTWTLVVILFGVWLIYSAFKKWKRR